MSVASQQRAEGLGLEIRARVGRKEVLFHSMLRVLEASVERNPFYTYTLEVIESTIYLRGPMYLGYSS